VLPRRGATTKDAPAREESRELFALAFVEGLDTGLQSFNEGNAELREQPVMARKCVVECRIIDEAPFDRASDVDARLFHFIADGTSIFGQAIERLNNDALLARRGLESLEQSAQHDPAGAAAPTP
jgi:hypothetical protein